MTMDDFDAYFMKMALREAARAEEENETPLGCVVVEPAVLEPAHDGHPAIYDPDPSLARILGRGHNQTEVLTDATAHAEMLAMSAAFQAKASWRLTGARLYATKEPCPMCAGAIVLARIDAVVWGVGDSKRGGGTVFHIFDHPGINHHPTIVEGVYENESRSLIQGFFRRRRIDNSAIKDEAL